MIELGLDTGKLSLQRCPLVHKALLKDGERRAGAVGLHSGPGRNRCAREPLRKLGEGAVEVSTAAWIATGCFPPSSASTAYATSPATCGMTGSNRWLAFGSIARTGTPTAAARFAPDGEVATAPTDPEMAAAMSSSPTQAGSMCTRSAITPGTRKGVSADACFAGLRLTTTTAHFGSAPRAATAASTRRSADGAGRPAEASITTRRPVGTAPQRRSRSARRRSTSGEKMRLASSTGSPDCAAVPPRRSWVAGFRAHTSLPFSLETSTSPPVRPTANQTAEAATSRPASAPLSTRAPTPRSLIASTGTPYRADQLRSSPSTSPERMSASRSSSPAPTP